jgi:hypothetical protein
MLMHSCHHCGEPWAIWLCGVILPLLFLAGCVGFLWFESGHQTRCLIDRRRRCPAVCLVVHSTLRLPLRRFRVSVACGRQNGAMRRARGPFDVRYSQYCVCIL